MYHGINHFPYELCINIKTAACNWSNTIQHQISNVKAADVPSCYSGDLLSFSLSNPLFIFEPLDRRVTENIEELAPQFQVSWGICKGFAPDLANNLRSWRERDPTQTTWWWRYTNFYVLTQVTSVHPVYYTLFEILKIHFPRMITMYWDNRSIDNIYVGVYHLISIKTLYYRNAKPGLRPFRNNHKFVHQRPLTSCEAQMLRTKVRLCSRLQVQVFIIHWLFSCWSVRWVFFRFPRFTGLMTWNTIVWHLSFPLRGRCQRKLAPVWTCSLITEDINCYSELKAILPLNGSCLFFSGGFPSVLGLWISSLGGWLGAWVSGAIFLLLNSGECLSTGELSSPGGCSRGDRRGRFGDVERVGGLGDSLLLGVETSFFSVWLATGDVASEASSGLALGMRILRRAPEASSCAVAEGMGETQLLLFNNGLASGAGFCENTSTIGLSCWVNWTLLSVPGILLVGNLCTLCKELGFMLSSSIFCGYKNVSLVPVLALISGVIFWINPMSFPRTGSSLACSKTVIFDSWLLAFTGLTVRGVPDMWPTFSAMFDLWVSLSSEVDRVLCLTFSLLVLPVSTTEMGGITTAFCKAWTGGEVASWVWVSLISSRSVLLSWW